METPRVAIVGARRRRQGLGPFVARFLKEAGAEVAGVLATRRETLEEAVGALEARHGIRTRGYLSLEALLRSESPGALAILSPQETHREYLEAALDAGLHVLCEKPFLWGGEAPAEAAGRIVEGFGRRRLALWENCPWPYTLPAYERLHPGVLAGGVRRFEMLLSPVSTGLQMIADAMPHALSLLQAIAPGGRAGVEDVVFSTRAIDAPDLTSTFRFLADGRAVEAEVRLLRQKTQPREAAYAVDGRWARRTVRMEDYAIFFGDGPRVVDVPDPLALLVRDFVRHLREGGGEGDGRRGEEIRQRMELLVQLARAYEAPGRGETVESRDS